jgi:hypothetical protein
VKKVTKGVAQLIVADAEDEPDATLKPHVGVQNKANKIRG